MGEERNRLNDEQIDLIIKNMIKTGEIKYGRGSALYDKIERVAVNLGFFDIRQMDLGYKHPLTYEDYLKVSDKIWELITNGTLAPGYNRNNPWFPWLHLTEKGKKIREKLIKEDNAKN